MLAQTNEWWETIRRFTTKDMECLYKSKKC